MSLNDFFCLFLVWCQQAIIRDNNEEVDVGIYFRAGLGICLLHYMPFILNSPSMRTTRTTENGIRLVTKYFQIFCPVLQHRCPGPLSGHWIAVQGSLLFPHWPQDETRLDKKVGEVQKKRVLMVVNQYRAKKYIYIYIYQGSRAPAGPQDEAGCCPQILKGEGMRLHTLQNKPLAWSLLSLVSLFSSKWFQRQQRVELQGIWRELPG